MALYTIGNKIVKVENKLAGTEASVISLSKTTFNSATKVLRSLNENERAIFIIRHSNRDKDKYAQDDPINATGIANADHVGELIGTSVISADDIYCGATDTRRTCETAYEISKSRGDTIYTSWTSINTLNSWSSKSGNTDNGLGYIAASTFTSETVWQNVLNSARANIQTIGANVTSAAISHTSGKNKKLCILVSHDSYLVPYVAYASGLQSGSTTTYNIEIIPGEGAAVEWINYMSGVAIIVKSDGTLKDIYPLKCLSTGTSLQ